MSKIEDRRRIASYEHNCSSDCAQRGNVLINIIDFDVCLNHVHGLSYLKTRFCPLSFACCVLGGHFCDVDNSGAFVCDQNRTP